jgi:dihydroxyacetone kinase-like protein
MSKLTETIEAVAQMILHEKDYLSDLDAKIGDGDHGINMARGFGAVLDELDELDHPENPKLVLHTVGETILENVGGAAGPLYGTAFLRASDACSEDEKLTIASVDRLLSAAIAGIKKRGHAERGDKTMLDVLIPIHECFTAPYAEGSTLYECLADANQAANEGVEYTKTIAARKGRASYLGERSIGYEDPGAVSSMLMFRAAYQFLNR